MILPKSDRGIRCPCGSCKFKVHWVRPDVGRIERSRECLACKRRTRTMEVEITGPAEKS